ncbi:MarR family transcriptional regulator [Brevibacillus borstelensis]|uniref:MarR family winged helix-turn-helix transcriptional regulator n=1 Tax=Brevibacillus borstelensis TaxID=45462 RepID=UPI002E249A2A|nr:MarR family transcriptional regulator [Brevibacillus borstelensis]
MTDRFRDSLGHNLHRVGQLIREETAKALGPYGITPEQWQLLVATAQTDGLTPSELGKRTLRDKTTISRILPGLLKKGWLKTEPHSQDARSYIVKMAPDKVKVIEETLEAVRDHFTQSVFAPFSKAEQDMFLSMVVRLRDHLEK